MYKRQIFGHGLGVFAVPLHAHGQRFQAQVEDEGGDGLRRAAKIAHQLRAGLVDVGGAAKALCVDDAVVALVRLGQLGDCLLYTSHTLWPL